MATYARSIHTITFSPFIMLAGTPRACSMTGINAYWCVLRLFPIGAYGRDIQSVSWRRALCFWFRHIDRT